MNIALKYTLTLIVLALLAMLWIGCGQGEISEISVNKLAQIAIWEDCRQADSLIFDYLSDPSPLVRARACYAIGLIAPPAASGHLVGLLADPERSVRLEAIFALGLLADSAYSESMLPLIHNPDPEISRQAIIALGRMGGEIAISALIPLTPDSLPEIRSAAAEALWRANAVGAVPALLRLAEDRDADVEWSAIYALRRLKQRAAAEKLRSRLRDTIPEIRMEAARGLEGLNDSASFPALSQILSQEREWKVKVNLISAVRQVGDKRAVKTLLNLLNPNEHPLVVAEALDAVAVLKINALIPRIQPLLGSENSTIRGAALYAMARLDGEKMLPILQKELETDNWWLKKSIALSLQAIGTEQATQLLVGMLEDHDPRVRAQALSSLAELDYRELDKILQAALYDPDWGGNATAAEIVRQKRLGKFLGRISELYTGARHNLDLRFALIYPLDGWIVDSQITEAAVADLLSLALSDERRIVRNLAIEHFARAGIFHRDKLGKFKTDLTGQSYANYYDKFNFNPLAKIITERGTISIELLYNQAPKTVVNFIHLAESGFFNDLIFHRVVPNFVIQTGDPRGDGMGGPGYTIRCEYNRHEFVRGTVGMAHSGKDTGGSQFFICPSAQPHLNARYTAFGQVVEGLSVVDQILVGDKIRTVEIIYPE